MKPSIPLIRLLTVFPKPFAHYPIRPSKALPAVNGFYRCFNLELVLKYETDEQKIFDVLPYISGEWFGKLGDSKYFYTVRLSDNTVQWLDGQDIAPHELYELSVQYDS